MLVRCLRLVKRDIEQPKRGFDLATMRTGEDDLKIFLEEREVKEAAVWRTVST